MKKIVLLPLDERPCNFDYPHRMPKTECTLLLPPKEIMGKKKKAGDTEQIARWLLDNVADTDAMIISLDTLLYGGIVPSRLHELDVETLTERADILKVLRAKNPTMQLYVFGLIMRCPTYSSDDEEPDYYADFGADIHLYGKYTHLEKLRELTEKEALDFARIRSAIDQDALADYLHRRKINLSALMHALTYAENGVVDYFIVPQDDAAPYGFTAMDQMVVREYLKQNSLHRRTALYPSADDIGLTLLARANAVLYGRRPKVYVHYASEKGALTIPRFEDRIVGETIKYHILSVNGIQVYTLAEADILLAVNVGSSMEKPKHAYDVVAYDIERNLAELVNYMDYALSEGKIVAVADIARTTGADTELTELMQRERLLLQVHAYAGWNTSSNTIGTALCQAVLYAFGRDHAGNSSFLLHRYYEDIGYIAYVRGYVREMLSDMGYNYFCVDGEAGRVADLVKDTLVDYMGRHYPELAKQVAEVRVKMPWSRMFEADVMVSVIS